MELQSAELAEQALSASRQYTPPLGPNRTVTHCNSPGVRSRVLPLSLADVGRTLPI